MRLLPLCSLVSALVLLAVVPGCADEEVAAPYRTDPFATRQAITFNEKAVNVDQHFADSAIVLDDKVVVPSDAANAPLLAKIVVGSVIAGNRSITSADLKDSKNPYGFLRRVTEIHTEGATTVLATERAELSDWIEEGDLFYNDDTRIFGGPTSLAAPGVGTQSLGIQSNTGSGAASGSAPLDTTLEGDETSSPDGKIKVRPVIKLSNASFGLNAKFDGYFKVRKTWWVPTSVKFRSQLTLDPVVAADIQAGVAVRGAGTGVGTQIGVPLWEKSWRGQGIMIPIPAPIPLTLRFVPEVRCSLSATGSVTATVHAEIKGHAAAGFEGGAGVSGFDWKDLSEAPTLSPSLNFVGVQGKATMTASCEILAVPVLLAFDAIGLQGKVGPYVSLNAEACASYDQNQQTYDGALSLYEQHGLAGEFSGRAQIPFLGIGKDFELLRVAGLKSDPLYLLGDGTCDVKSTESCKGRPDGFYCSDVATYSGFFCEGGQIALGRQCEISKTCVGGSRTAITCK